MSKDVFEPGRYTIGDPCYFFSDKDSEEWFKFLDDHGYFHTDSIGYIGPHKVAVLGTQYGDGTYQDSDGRSYDVDSGLIAIIPIAEDSDVPHGHNVVEMNEEFTCEAIDGVLYFGDVHIDTSGMDDYESYDDGYGDDDDVISAEDEDEYYNYIHSNEEQD